jgi:hypothetical protein
VILFSLGSLESAIAVVLICFGWSLPGKQEVEQSFQSVERATRRTGDQVDFIRAQVHDLRRPELKELATRLQEQTRLVARTLRKQKIDYTTLATVSDSLGQVAEGLDNTAQTLNPESVAKIGEGLGHTADFLDERLIPAAATTADDLDASLAGMRKDAKQLATLLRSTSPNLAAAQEIHDGLARFSEGLARMNVALKLDNMAVMRDGFKGLESSLTSGAEQVEELSGYTYPVVTFSGLRPEVEQRKFWSKGDDIARGMRKAAEGVKGASKELDRLAAELPKLRETLDESRRVAEKTRDTMAAALKQRDQVEPLLKQVPEQAARMAEALPRLGGDLAKILRDTDKLKDVAIALRQAQQSIDMAVEHWPQMRTTMGRSAAVLRATQSQLNQALENRQEYEAAMRQTILLAETFAILLPDFTEQIDRQLAENEFALKDLGQSIHEVGTTVPVYERTAVRMVQTARLLLWLLGPIFALHGLYLVWSGRPRRKRRAAWHPIL